MAGREARLRERGGRGHRLRRRANWPAPGTVDNPLAANAAAAEEMCGPAVFLAGDEGPAARAAASPAGQW